MDEENPGNKISLTLLNGTGYVFEVEDYMKLRRDHHIVGSLVGTCASRGWSGSECTMPVELTPWETCLLVEQGLAVLVSKKTSLLREENEQERKHYQEQLEQRISQQEEALKDEKLKQSEGNIEKILAGKRKKLLKQGVPEKDIKLDPQEILNEIRQSIKFERKNALLDIPCAHPEPHDACIVTFPDSDTSLKYLVFRDLWSRGKYVTCGDAFGADFLIYPGDPLQYHASHVVVLLENGSMKALELVANVRLSVMVNKLCVVAYFDNEGDKDGGGKDRKIAYQTITWMGDKDKERRQFGNINVNTS
ncbi:tRNA-splicing endonuclease subunit Sen34-like [Musca domestica]|uniref:tRNA-splicing endonuclease subunit Sen34 n=1 Tax=Musca domestica TaxID=7370 RepID=A0ABM3VKN0_MUSDO|nr:tRNA-splicing endonuclease subunit Sen34-like [Musca domestica]